MWSAGISDRPVAAGHAGQHEHAVLAERRRLEHERAVAGRLEDQVERAVALGRCRRASSAAHVAAADRLDQLGCSGTAASRRDTTATSRPRSRRTSAASSPIVPAPITAARSGRQTRSRRWISNAWRDALLGDGQRLQRGRPPVRALGHRHDERGVVDVLLGQVAVEQVDAALQVHVVGGHVLEPDHGRRCSCPAAARSPPTSTPGRDRRVTLGPTASTRPKFSWPMTRKSSPSGAGRTRAAMISRPCRRRRRAGLRTRTPRPSGTSSTVGRRMRRAWSDPGSPGRTASAAIVSIARTLWRVVWRP